jgi:ArsR family transcriptional regulator
MATDLAEPTSFVDSNSEDAARFPELSVQLEKDLVQVFKLLSDETRLRILMYLLRENELHVTALCDKLGQSQPAVSHHLALLRVAGLIEARRDGKHNFYSIRKKHFHRIMAELFQKIGEAGRDELRFDEFVLTHEGN